MADIRSQLKDLSDLVGDLVELARGAEEPGNFEDVGLDALVESAIRRAARDAPSLRFTFDGDGSIVRGAPGQLARAIANLLDNAAKWSPPDGEITVTVREGELTVRDRGPGIPEADLPHVFDRFYRSSTARRTPGSGLGLAIVRQAAAGARRRGRGRARPRRRNPDAIAPAARRDGGSRTHLRPTHRLAPCPGTPP